MLLNGVRNGLVEGGVVVTESENGRWLERTSGDH